MAKRGRRFYTQEPKPEIWNIDLVQQQAAAAGDWLAQQARTALLEEVRDSVLEQPIHSPIEAVFFAWWLAVDRLESGHGDVADSLMLSPQVIVTTGDFACRPDFIVWPANSELLLEAEEAGLTFRHIAVELDGHDFHERTKEQVNERNQRDRHLQQAGWAVFHFSGSEVVHEPERCVREVREMGLESFWRISADLYRRKSQRQIDATPKPVL